MARVTIQSQAIAVADAPVEQRFQDVAAIVILATGLAALADPGIVLGALAFALWRWIGRPAWRPRLLVVALPLLALAALHSVIVVGWPWRLWFPHTFITTLPPIGGRAAAWSLAAETLAGPLWAEATAFAVRVLRRRVDVRVQSDRRLDRRRWRALRGQRQPDSLVPDPHASPAIGSPARAHPPGSIRLGEDQETNRPLDLAVPAEIASHIFLAGVSGTGKTTTVARLGDGALANGYSLVIIDCKGGDLGQTARELAARHALPFHLVDPDQPDRTLGYNPCTGDAASVANKLVGAFTFSPAAEIYKNIAMEAIPAVVRGLQAAGRAVTLEALYDAFDVRGLARIAEAIPATDQNATVRQRLLALARHDDDRVGKGGSAGLRHRLGALLEGRFGDLFRTAPNRTLDWEAALSRPAVTYAALSTLASSEDVELMGRVIAQDLKQVCARRVQARGRGLPLVPALVVFDEFAALDEADQLTDLLLQARQALMPTVVSTQYLPESVPLRKAVLGAGLLIAHRVEGEDAEALAKQFGTRPASEVTHQIDYETGHSEKGTVRWVDRFNVHPNELRTFQTGQAAIRSAARQRYTVVRVYPDSA